MNAPDRAKIYGAMILAAGASVRMGQPKQLLRINGEPLLLRTVNTVRAAVSGPCVVVLGASHEIIAPVLHGLDAAVVINEQWPEGMAASIRSGLRALLATDPDLPGVLITLCDQPALSVEALQALTAALDANHTIAAAHYDDHLGAPVLFGREHFYELAALQGAEGARAVFMKHRAQVAAVALPELAADLDTPEDYAAWVKKGG